MNAPQLFASLFRLGVRQKVVLVLITVLLTALSISSWLAFEQDRNSVLTEINQRGQDVSRFAARTLVSSLVSYDYRAIQDILDELILSEDVAYARVLSNKGNPMAEAGTYLPDNTDSVLFKVPVTLGNDVVGRLELAFSTARTLKLLEQRKYSTIKREALIILLIAVGEFFALSLLIIRPVCRITDSIDTGMINPHEAEMVPVDSNDEFGYLATSFNRLYTQLKAANRQLESRVQLADQKLIESNRILTEQAEELKALNARFEQLSMTDDLTGLFNRRQFEVEFQRAMARSRRYGEVWSALIIDADHFKQINDSYGHPCGDAVLKSIASLLRNKVRDTDVLFRIGGEEFAVICPSTDRDGAMGLAEKLRAAMASHEIVYLDLKIRVTISIGAATLNHEAAREDDYALYRHADAAVYASKQGGRNRVTHFDDLVLALETS